METRRSRLAADVAVHSDGGGKVPAAMKPITGIDDVMKLQAGLARVFAGQMSRIERYGLVNGLPGFISIEQDGILQTTALVIRSEEHTSELQSIMRTSYAVFCLKKKNNNNT